MTGSFEAYEVVLDYNPDNPAASSLEARINVASVNTGNTHRDEHLRTAAWCDADNYPYMTFKSTSVRRVGDGQLVASGPLTIEGIPHQIELPVTILGQQMIPDPMPKMLGGTKEVAGFMVSKSSDLGDFEVGTGSWAATMVIGAQVDIEILLEAHNR